MPQFVVVVRRGTFTTMAEATRDAAAISQHDLKRVLSVSVEQKHGRPSGKPWFVR